MKVSGHGSPTAAFALLLLVLHASTCRCLIISAGWTAAHGRTHAPTLPAIAPGNVSADTDVAEICRHLEGMHAAKAGAASLPFSCQLAAVGSLAAESGDAICSPVCGEALDVVVVLGSSDRSLRASDGERTKRAAVELLEHFQLHRGAEGSLFAFIDVSHGARLPPRVLSLLTDNRKALVKALEAWQPTLGGNPVPSADLAGLEHRPEVLSLLKNSRSSARQTLLVLAGPNPDHDTFQRNSEIMETLVSACPAVVIKPHLKCGRMRWGAGEANGTKIRKWGDGHSK